MKRIICWLIGHDWKVGHVRFLIHGRYMGKYEGGTKEITYKCFRCDEETTIAE